MRIVDPLRQPEMAATHRGVVPPFLPTLGLALVAGLLSLACREPAEAPARAAERPPVMAVAPGLSSFDPGRALVGADLAPVPASEAFARLVPLVAASEPSARPAQAQASARLERRRPAPSRLAVTPPAPATLPASAKASPEAAPAAVAAAPESRRFLPGGALPFADTADAVWDAARGLGTGVASLGSSVTTLVSDLR